MFARPRKLSMALLIKIIHYPLHFFGHLCWQTLVDELRNIKYWPARVFILTHSSTIFNRTWLKLNFLCVKIVCAARHSLYVSSRSLIILGRLIAGCLNHMGEILMVLIVHFSSISSLWQQAFFYGRERIPQIVRNTHLFHSSPLWLVSNFTVLFFNSF